VTTVDRCVCCELPFASVLALARREGLTTLEEVRQRIELGTGCGLCLPYAATALATGTAAVPIAPSGPPHIE
jgi:bacterioferritin-associated ferredoxin